MIQAQEIVTRVLAELDAEGSDRYLWEEDFRPAINNTKEWVVAMYNKLFADNKLTEESLRELTWTGMWKLSSKSRFAFDSTHVGRALWSIVAIYPKAEYEAGSSATTLPDEEWGQYDEYRAFIRSRYSAKRITAEERQQAYINPFAAGSDVFVCEDLLTYAYVNFQDYSSEVYNPHGNPVQAEVEIIPSLPNEYIGMTYLSYPVDVVNITDVIRFPDSMSNLFVQKVANMIAMKEDAVELRKYTETELNQLVQLMT